MQFRTMLLREALIGRIAHEDVAEPVRVLARELRVIRADELLTHERLQVPRDTRFQIFSG
jgi:hypothetical protein